MTARRYNKRNIGAEYEKRAGDYLKTLGYEILEYNFRCKMGEVDIVARDGEYLVFCEVKYRTDERKGHPAEAVGFGKQKVLSKCALAYLMMHGMADVACRFDVISIEGDKLTLYQNAFDYIG